MGANRAYLGSFFRLADVTAVQALPDDLLALLEYPVFLDIGQEQLIALLMLLFDLRHSLKERRDLRKALFARGLRKAFFALDA